MLLFICIRDWLECCCPLFSTLCASNRMINYILLSGSGQEVEILLALQIIDYQQNTMSSTRGTRSVSLSARRQVRPAYTLFVVCCVHPISVSRVACINQSFASSHWPGNWLRDWPNETLFKQVSVLLTIRWSTTYWHYNWRYLEIR